MVKFIQDQGGLLTLQDLADCRAQWQEPIHTGYRGYTVYEAPPNSSGHVLLQELSLVEQFDLQSLGCNTAESIHLMVEAKKLAFADREAYVADPRFMDIPIEGLVSKEYARERAGLIDLQRAATRVAAGNPWGWQPGRRDAPAAAVRQEEDTTCFVVVDRWGNAVCQLQSLQSGWGSSVVAGDTGILLNNRMTYWHLDPSHVDYLQPGKRVRHTMNPVMVFKDGGSAKGNSRQLVLACGTPGADTQVQTNLQVITHVLDFGMTVAEAVEAPRWRDTHGATESTIPHEGDDLLYLEARYDEQVRAGLSGKGHRLEIIGPWDASGCEVMIQVDPATGGAVRRGGPAAGRLRRRLVDQERGRMSLPGEQRSRYPDECGHRAGAFAEAIRDGDMDLAWSMLSKETRGMRMGVWATRNDVDMQVAYRAGYDAGHPMRASMMEDFRNTVLRLWPLEDLTDLGVSPTSYLDDEHAFAFLPFGASVIPESTAGRRLLNGLILPMLLEDGEWRVDLPSWRFVNPESEG